MKTHNTPYNFQYTNLYAQHSIYWQNQQVLQKLFMSADSSQKRVLSDNDSEYIYFDNRLQTRYWSRYRAKM